MHDYPNTLRIVSLNCWGLKFISAHRHARLVQIGHEIANSHPPPDIVALQECWTQADYQSIRQQTLSILPHGKYYHSGIFGGGLVILSRFPIVESSMQRYPLNGRPTAFFRGDWFVGKGVACAALQIGPGENDILQVLNTHLHAPYEKEPNDSYICHRTAQAWEIAKLACAAAQRGHTVVAVGDFNMVPSSLAHRIVSVHGGLTDVWRVLYPDSAVGAAEDEPERKRGRETPNIAYNIEKNGTTCDSGLNTWRMSKERQKRVEKKEEVVVDLTEHDHRAKRLDYIFFSSPRARQWTVKSAVVGMTGIHPTLKCSLSDHFSIETELFLSPSSTSDQIPHDALPSTTPAEPLPHTIPPPTADLPTQHLLHPDIYTQIQALITVYLARENRQRRLRLGHFLVSIAVSIGCFIAVWWAPHNYVAFLLLLLSTLGFGAGVLDGLIGGLFVGSEVRALWEFEWEVGNARRRAEACLGDAGSEKTGDE